MKSPVRSKKLRVVLPDGRTVDFGARGFSDYTKHKDPSRMRRYVVRHGGRVAQSVIAEENPAVIQRKMLRVALSDKEVWTVKGLGTAGFWARWLLWSHPTLAGAKKIMRDKFGVTFVPS